MNRAMINNTNSIGSITVNISSYLEIVSALIETIVIRRFQDGEILGIDIDRIKETNHHVYFNHVNVISQ